MSNFEILTLSKNDKQTLWAMLLIGIAEVVFSVGIASGILVFEGMPESVRDSMGSAAIIGLLIIAGSGTALYTGTRK